ncbi:hypothetical protein [Acidovorax sp. sic0104]|uniref:hypothetical protein n=1 Tax=Acidovorax sp. sic0104 TaxID=2854784 RepID=UPI001C49701A|nr:hypothetical protein [Acidovorax sp. sic0104]MBV7541816.1 hypothetical protein [Acidovorax sp. sic0104]
MLTQIEWWGGLIFVLGAVTYKLVMGALEKKEEGIDWYRWLMHAFFLMPAVVLAGYFYPLEQTGLQYGYLGVLAASLAVVLAMLVQEITGDGPEDAHDKADGVEREGEEEKEKEKEPQPSEEDEETGWLMTVVGALVLYSPVLVACGLGSHKAWPMVQRLL